MIYFPSNKHLNLNMSGIIDLDDADTLRRMIPSQLMLTGRSSTLKIIPWNPIGFRLNGDQT